MPKSSSTSARCGGAKSGPQGPQNVLLGTGEFRWTQPGLEIAGRGLDFEWALNYRSQPASGQANWRHSYQIVAGLCAEGVEVWDGDGDRVVYVADGAGTYAADGVAAEGKLARGAFRLRFADGGVWTFRRFDAGVAAGAIERIEDNNRNALIFEYGETGLLVAVVDTLGRKVAMAWGGRGRLESITDFTGRQLQYRYNGTGQLVSVRYPALTETPTGNNFAKGALVTFGYDAGGMLNAISDRAGQAAVGVEYGGKGQVATIRRGTEPATFIEYEADAVGTLVTTNDPAGNVRDYLFDGAKRCIRMRVYSGRAESGRLVNTKSNRPGKALRQGEPGFYETRYFYHDRHGWLVRKELAGGGTISNDFELDKNPAAPAIERGNLRAIRYRSGAAGAKVKELVRHFEYAPGFGCGCGEEFVTRETDFRGAVTQREFDKNGNLVRKVDRSGMVTAIRRNSFGDMVERVLEARETIPGRTDQFRYSPKNGQLQTETLDATGLKVTTAYGYDDLGRPTLVRDAAGQQHKHIWNAWDRLVRRVLPDGTTEDALYDANNRKTGRVVEEAGVKMREEIQRDALGRTAVIKKETGRNRSVTEGFAYDANGRRTARNRGEAEASRMDFDARGLPLRRVRGRAGEGSIHVSFTHNAEGNLVSVTRGTGKEETALQTVYDGFGRIESMVFPDGSKSVVTCDGNGNAIQIVKLAAGQSEPIETVTQSFDSMDRLILRTVRRPGAMPGGKDSWKYDARGRLVESTVGGLTTTMQYDALDRCVSKSEDGVATEFTYDQNSNVLSRSMVGAKKMEARYKLDSRGRTTRVDGPGGWFWEAKIGHRDRTVAIATPEMNSTLDYDLLGRLTRVVWGSATKPVAMQLEWDEASRLTGLTDPAGNKTTYGFDAASNAVSTTPPDGKAWTRSYDSRGNCSGWKDANGTVVKNTYDSMDRLIRRVVSPGVGVAKDTKTEAYDYDAFGRLVAAKNDAHSIERQFEEGSTIEKQDGRVIASRLDKQGRPASVTYPSGYALAFAYRGTGVKVSDASGVAVELDGGQVRYARVGLKVETSAGVTGLPERMEASVGKKTIFGLQYEWDAAGNLAKVEKLDIRGKFTRKFGLDAYKRLVNSESSDGQTSSYEIDVAGNRKTVSLGGKSGRYAMEGVDRAMNRYTLTPEGRCDYDANGNLIELTDASGKRKMKYDYRNRMVEHVAADGTLTRYTYDCFDRRLTKTVSQGRIRSTFTYSYEGDLLVEIRNETSGTTQSLLRVGQSVLGMLEGGNQTWLVCDAAGSVVAELGADGKVNRIFDYGDYGQVAVFDGNGKGVGSDGTLPPVLFAGYTFDAETKFLKTATRYLEPALGRFTTPDPAGAWFDGLAKGNAYAYAAHNPVTFSDPTGLSTCRTYSCGGPWPGPRQITVEFEGCSKTRRNDISHAVCWAFRGSGQAERGVTDRWITDISGQPQPNRVSKANLNFWFAGPDGVVSNPSKSHIASSFGEIFEATKSDDFDIDCEDNSSCDGANAYVNWGGYDVNLCPNFWTKGDRVRGSILIHELSHGYADTDDYFYYTHYPSNQPFNSLYETGSLRENADTYESFVRDVYF